MPKHVALFYLTDLQSAENIITNQSIPQNPAGEYGPGFYLGKTIKSCQSQINGQMCYLVADVFIGQVKKNKGNQKLDVNQVKSQGYDSIRFSVPNGINYFLFDSTRIKNIKYTYGARPKALLQCNEEKITLFIATSVRKAIRIYESEDSRHPYFPYIEKGPFGDGYYLYDSITDALEANKKGETVLVASVKMKYFYHLQNNERINRKLADQYLTFLGDSNGKNTFIILDRKLISKIHYCGGQDFRS